MSDFIQQSMTLYMVGRIITYPGHWNFRGVFSDKVKAIGHCRSDMDFVLPIRLNEPLPVGEQDWAGVLWPVADGLVPPKEAHINGMVLS